MLKSALKTKQITFGVTLGIGSPEVSYALGSVGLDWINFDLQHTTIDLKTVVPMLQAMSYSGTVPIVRVPANEIFFINKALDMGAQGLIIPIVNSRNEAERALSFAKYPPKGMRSFGQRAIFRDPEYVTTADDEIMVIPQIETELALQNLEEIVSTDGIDGVFIGPYDLSMSLGVFRQFDNPKYVRAVEAVVSACEANGVAPGLLASTGPIEQTVQQGFRMISLGGDLGLMMEAVTRNLKNARSAAKIPHQPSKIND